MRLVVLSSTHHHQPCRLDSHSSGFVLRATRQPSGLFTAVLTAAIYIFFGSSMQLCVGPVALVSLLTAQLINKYFSGTFAITRLPVYEF
mmetsp:Transcript_4508/g.4931  ORF Transcript_4508/g.4931 Transcript_4508/m.4931 type:complete len:89 (+) Transcript_4508:173-439(+)